MKKLIAMTAFAYNGRRLKPADEFTAKDRDAKLLVLLGRALSVESNTPAKPTKTETVVVAETTTLETNEGETLTLEKGEQLEVPVEEAKPRRTYRRKDAKPEETKAAAEVEPANEVKAHGLEDLV